jgi:hypothetical protein
MEEYGKLTLNEVLIDGGRLLLSATFEPREGVKFNDQMHPMPTVRMNGENLTTQTGGQTVEINQSMYTIYNDVLIKDIPFGEEIKLHIIYDRLDLDQTIENPWAFEITVSTQQVASRSETIDLNQAISLGNGQTIWLKNIMVTPISTVLYYDWPEDAPHIGFKIVNQNGEEIMPSAMSITGEDSFNRYETTLDLEKGKYYLVPFESSPNPHAQDPGPVPEQAILINP